jgi:PKD repeat protein
LDKNIPMSSTLKRILLVLIIMIQCQSSWSQCVIDTTQTGAGIYPDTLPIAVAGQPYDVDVTFIMLTDTLGLTIYNYQIANVTGLPIGVSWQCNNFAIGCNYDPSITLYGCVDISGTPLFPGNYIMTVTVIADVQLAGNQVINFDVPLTVIPGTVSNPGFSMTNSIGCDPLTVSFQNNNPGQSAYLWDFGNGLQSNQENPPSQTYTIPGAYVVTQTVTPNVTPDWYLTNITVSAIPNNYGGFVDDPDMYFLLYDPSGNLVYDSHPSVSNTFPPVSWTLPNILLQNGTYSVHVWDEDGGLFGSDDDLGEITFAGNGSSGSGTGTVGGASGQLIVDYTIFQTPVVPLVATDTVYVYATPAMPVITSTGPLVICEGDTLVLSVADTINDLQWYENGMIMIGEISNNLIPSVTANYSVTVTSPGGCIAASAQVPVVINPLPLKPNIFVNGNVFATGVGGLNYQWYLNGLPIAGATDSFLVANSTGTYILCGSDSNGCVNCSDSLVYLGTGIATAGSHNGYSIYPNPSSGHFTLLFSNSSERTILILDNAGRAIDRTFIGESLRFVYNKKLAAGIYFIGVQEKNNAFNFTKLLVK